MRKRFVLWAAVSSQPQVEKISLENQIKLGHEHAARHDGAVVAELIVPGESRDITLFEDACRKIPAYAQLYDLIRERSFDVLTFYNRSRLGRDAALSMTIVSLCYRHGIIPYDLESPPASLETQVNHSELLIGAIKSVGAQQEIMEMVRRNRDGVLDRVRKGEFPYQEAWGWIRHYDNSGKLSRIDIDPVAAEVWRIILELYLERGYGIPAIADELNRRGVSAPRGGQWRKTSISWLFEKIWRYAGYTEVNVRSRKGRPYLRAKAIWPPIINDEDVLRVQAEQQRRVNARRAVGAPFRFSLCVYCVACGHRMVVQSRAGRQNEAYRCTRHAGLQCNAWKIHEALEAAIRLLSDASQLQGFINNTDDRRSIIQQKIENLQIRLSGIDNALLRADDAYTSGAMDSDRYRRQLNRINQQRTEIQAQLTQCHNQMTALEHEDRREQRMYDIRDLGHAMLNHPDVRLANTWLRQHFQIWIADGQVQRIEYL